MVNMSPQRMFEVMYAPITKSHFRAIESKFYSLIREAIESQLRFQPDVQTRNRTPLKRPIVFGARWELRCGLRNRFRVFYKIDREMGQVSILAVGEKRGERLVVGGEEIGL